MISIDPMANKIQIIDAGLGNISSVARMINKVGGTSSICSSPEEINLHGKIIIPGVGSFDHGLSMLYKHGFDNSFWESLKLNKAYILGICLGMHVLCLNSEEGKHPGLGLINAKVKKFRFEEDKNMKIPHMGWNVVRSTRENLLIPKSNEERRFYFVHSYHVVPNDPSITVGISDYGHEFCAAFQKNNIIGVQFHPEKSHRFGMALMKYFVTA